MSWGISHAISAESIEAQLPKIDPTSPQPIGRFFQHTTRCRCSRAAAHSSHTICAVHRATLVLLPILLSLQFLIFLDRCKAPSGMVVAETLQVNCFAVHGITTSIRRVTAWMACFQNVGFFALAPNVESLRCSTHIAWLTVWDMWVYRCGVRIFPGYLLKTGNATGTTLREECDIKWVAGRLCDVNDFRFR